MGVFHKECCYTGKYLITLKWIKESDLCYDCDVREAKREFCYHVSVKELLLQEGKHTHKTPISSAHVVLTPLYRKRSELSNWCK